MKFNVTTSKLNKRFIKGGILIVIGLGGLFLPAIPGIILIVLGLRQIFKKNENRTNTPSSL